MSDVFLPSLVNIASVSFRYIDSAGVSRNPYNATARTASRGGDRIGLTLQLTPAGGSSTDGAMRRRRMLSTLMALKGRQGRIWVTDPSYTPAGSFPATELLTNNEFSNGTTGWTDSYANLSVTDRVMRVVHDGSDATYSARLISPNVTVTQYAPYVARGFACAGQNMGSLRAYISDGSIADNGTSGLGLRHVALVASTTTASMILFGADGAGNIAGSFFETPWTSLSRCILADAGPNALLQSQTMQTTWSAVNASSTTNTEVAPDGTVTAEAIVEDSTAAAAHYLSQSVAVASGAADFTFSVCVNGATRNFGWIQISEATGGSAVYAYFDLTDGSWDGDATGANWSNLRKHVVALGNGWFRFSITARKTNAATSLTCFIGIASAAGTGTYTGDGSSYIRVWGASLAQSSVPVRYVATTTTATTGTAQTGSSIYVKGLPASTSGLLLAGDWVEIITSLGSQLSMLTSSLDSDAAGKGLMQVSPPIRGTVADNAAIIVHKPMARCMVTRELIEYLTEPGIISTASIDLEESPF